MKKFLMLIFSTMLSASLFGQIPGSWLSDSAQITKADSGKLFFQFENENFLRNLEYFGKFKEGYTLLGYQAIPSLSYYPTANSKITAGLFAMKYHGQNHYNELKPVFSFEYQFSPYFKGVIGSLHSTVNHKVIDPLLADEKYYTHRIEDGLQFTLNHPRLFADVWINWENVVFKNDTAQEEFTLGVSTEIKLLPPNKDFHLNIPINLIFTHHGGQVNNSPKPLETIKNSAIGIEMNYQDRIGFTAYWVDYQNQSGKKITPFANGNGFYGYFWVKAKSISVQTGYWQGHNYFSRQGEELFFNVSSVDGSTKSNRQLYFSKIYVQKTIRKNIRLMAGADIFIDPKDGQFDYAYTFQVNFNLRTNILKNINK
jgi:hypothetical protein